MKIKGVTTGKARGTKKGDPIEFTPKEKAPLAVQDAVKALSSKTEAKWAEDVVIISQHHTPKDTKKDGKYQNNAYVAAGTVMVRTHNLITDRFFPAKKHEFKIEFEDCLDPNGVPDLKIIKFEM